MTDEMRPLAEGGWGSTEFAGIRCGSCGALVAHAHVLDDGQVYVGVDGLTPVLSRSTPDAATGCDHKALVDEDDLRRALRRFRQTGKTVRLIGH